MKLILLLSVFVSTAAMAIVKPYGTFVPQSCSTGHQTVEVCYGYKVGIETRKYLSIFESDLGRTVYEITRSEPVSAGVNPTFFMSRLTLIDASGETRQVTEYGQADEIKGVELITKQGVTVRVGQFQMIFTIQ